eukprot:NODE_420_length_8944_cov_0.479819.p5 type:complete len:107 gc:universal NODE_420_length_8944_cov_0.479819:3668-3348(-)
MKHLVVKCGTLMKFNLESNLCPNYQLKVNGDHMKVRNMYFKYMRPYLIPLQSTVCVTTQYNGTTGILSLSLEIPDILTKQNLTESSKRFLSSAGLVLRISYMCMTL